MAVASAVCKGAGAGAGAGIGIGVCLGIVTLVPRTLPCPSGSDDGSDGSDGSGGRNDGRSELALPIKEVEAVEEVLSLLLSNLISMPR